MDVIALLSLCACVLAALLAVRVLIHPGDNPPAAWALAAFLVSTGAFVADQLAYQQDWFARFPHLYAVANPFIPAIFPSLYLYVRGVTHPTTRWSRATLGHFAVPVVVGLLELPTYWLSAGEKIAAAHAQLDRAQASPAEMVFLAGLNLYALVYAALAWRQVRAGRQRLGESSDEGRAHAYRGLEQFVALFSLLTLASALLDFTPWGFEGSLTVAYAAVVGAFTAFWLLANHEPLLPAGAGAPGAGSPSVPAPSPADAGPPAEATPAPDEAHAPREDSAADAAAAPADAPRPALRPAEVDRLRRRLEKLLLEEKLHLDAELSLQKLADRAETTRHKMSAAIREIHGQTFYQLIARLRVQEAARQLVTKAAAHRTISDVAFSVGFNTLSAFNAAFKGEFGVTPSVFRGRAGTREVPPESDRPAPNGARPDETGFRDADSGTPVRR
jgi:AraC-like DNA-binding protein